MQTPLRLTQPLTKLSFPKSARILKRAHFKKIVRNQCKWSGSTLLIDYRKGYSKRAKLGLTVTKRFGKAHDRNRFKRLVRESFRQLYPEIPSDLEMNILPQKRPEKPGAVWNDLKSFLSTLSNKSARNKAGTWPQTSVKGMFSTQKRDYNLQEKE